MPQPNGTNEEELSLSSADSTLKGYVADMLQNDGRFVGMSEYVSNIKFWWSNQIDTACAGYGFIFFNPKFWDSLDLERKKTIIAHEILHLVLEHLPRMGDKDPMSWNEATDYAINWSLKEDGFVVDGDFGPGPILVNPQYAGRGASSIYADIHNRKKKGEDTCKNEQKPEHVSRDQIEKMVKEALEEKGEGTTIQEQAKEAKKDAEEAKREGASRDYMGGGQCNEKVPGGQDRLLKTDGLRVEIQKATYNEIFEKYLTDPLSGGKRTYVRPPRRPPVSSIRLKGRMQKKGRSNRLKHLVYALDVSGSISPEDANNFLRTAKSIKDLLNPTLMTVMLWDTRIVFEKVFREDEKLDNIRITAGGSTNLGPVYSRVEQLNPEALVIFTDLRVRIPPKPKWETIWFVNSETCPTTHVTYGEVYAIPEK